MKKLIKKVPQLKEKFISSCNNKNFGEYVWETTMMPQMSYSFAKPHGLVYSFIAIQTLYLATNFPTIFWDCACLIVNAGGSELMEEFEEQEEQENETDKKNKSVNYGKVSKAIGEITNKGTEVSTPDINKSELIFKPDLESNTILYGLKGITRISTNFIYEIMEKRPYLSIEDFLTKVKINKLQMINLIKSGAFDNISGNRINAMNNYMELIADKKKRITLQNMMMLMKFNLIPEELVNEKRIYNFNKYLKKHKKEDYYLLDDISFAFYEKNFNIDLLDNIFNETAQIKQKTWDSIYNMAMDPMRNWLKKNKQEILNQLNQKLIEEVSEKYTEGSISKWEMDALGFYKHEHELKILNNKKYNIKNFFELKENPVIDRSFEKNGKTINMFKLYRIAGTVIDKDKNHHTISLLTEDGVVSVKIYKDVYAYYDRQISEKGADGKKHVLEKSWLSRGNKLIITGIRRDGNFIPKKYKSSPYKNVIEKIVSIDKNGIAELVTERLEVD